MTQANTDFGRVADDLRRAAGSFALLTSSATLFGGALNSFREFERQLTLTNAIAGGTVDQFNRMKEAARGFSLVTTVSAVDAGVALQQLAQAGFTAEESLQAMNGVLLLSQATLTDVAVTSDVLSSNIRAFKLEAADTSRVANVFTATITGSLATMDKLAFAFRQVAPVAELAGLSIEETSASLGVLFNVGLRGEQAGTALRNIIIRLIRPLGEASDLLQGASIATRQANGDLRNLADILRDIGNSDLTNADLARIFETEALAGVKAFISALEDIDESGDDAFTRLLKNVTGTDRALEIAAQNLDTFDGTVNLLRNNLTDLGISIGESLAEPIRNVADGVIAMAETFRGLDEATRTQIASLAGWTAAGIGLLAALNAIILILRGPLLAGMVKLLSVALLPITAAFKAMTAAVLAYGTAQATAAGAAAGSVTGFAALRVAIAAATSATVAFLATPVGAGLALITTGVAALGAAYVLATQDAREARREFERLEEVQFQGSLLSAQEFADQIIPPGVLGEVTYRVEQLQNQLRLLGTVGGPLDIFETAGRKANEASGRQSELRGLVNQLEEQFSDVKEYEVSLRRLRERYEAAVADADNIGLFGANPLADALSGAIEDIEAGLTTDQRARISALTEKRDNLLDQYELLGDVVDGFERGQDDAIRNLIQQLQDGTASVPDRLQPAAAIIANNVDLGPELALQVREAVQARADDGANVLETVIKELLNQAGLNPQTIADLFVTKQEADRAALDLAFSQVGAGLEGLGDEIREKALENELATAKTVSEATRAAVELANLELGSDLAELGDDLRAAYTEPLVEFGVLQNEAVQEAFDQALAQTEGIDTVALNDLVSGKALLDAISSQISADSSPEEIAAIIEEQYALFKSLMDNFAARMADAAAVDPSLVATVSQVASNSVNALKAAFAGAFGAVNSAEIETAKSVKSATSRIKKASGGGGKSKGGGKDPAKEALRDARKLEDAFRRAEQQSLKARQTFIDNVAGLDVNTRIAVGFDLDIEKINQDADRQIEQLKRKLEDLELDGKADAALKQRYAAVIKEIERARDAEIQAANSFDAQMKRRSDALDLFIRDLKTVGNEATDTFSKVAAGIGVAFAEYNKDLVTLVDITSEAVGGFLDAVTTGVADFIFDNENAFENFKKSMLNISRQIFEGFTKALLQQAISSLTDGGGSIFGNLLQPSKGNVGGANNEAPSVGTGGILGGLFGGQQQQGAGAGVASIQQGTAAIAQSLQQGAIQINQALATVGVQTRAGGAQVQGGLQGAAQQSQQGGIQVGQSLRQAGQQIGQAGGQAASNIRTQSAGGGGGGFFGGLLSLFGFANGGQVGSATAPTLQSIVRYATGGSVTGPGTGTSDDILAWLSNGEFVVNAKMTKEFMPLLEAINSGSIKGDVATSILDAMRGGGSATPAFASGGQVGSDNFYGAPSVSVTTPRPVLIERGVSQASTSNFNSTREGDTIINMRYVSNSSGGGSAREAKRSADQLAARLGAQIQRAKKNT